MPYYAFRSNIKFTADTLSKFFPDKTLYYPDALEAIIVTESSITYKLQLGQDTQQINISVSRDNKILLKWEKGDKKYYWQYTIEEDVFSKLDYANRTIDLVGTMLIIMIPKY